MSRYLFRRVIRAIVVVVGVSFISFAVLFLSGDPTDTMVGEDWTVQEVQELREDMGAGQALVRPVRALRGPGRTG